MSATNVQALVELAGRVEGLAGADREVDRDIHALVDGWEKRWNDEFEFFQLWKGDGWIGLGSVPAYTASLDAAMSLVPEGWDGALYLASDGHGPCVQLETPDMRERFAVDAEQISVTAATLPLALTAACLKARASLLARAAIEGEG